MNRKKVIRSTLYLGTGLAFIGSLTDIGMLIFSETKSRIITKWSIGMIISKV